METEKENRPKKSILKRKEVPSIAKASVENNKKRIDPPTEMNEEWEDIDTEFEDDYDDEYEDEEVYDENEEELEQEENKDMEIEEQKIDSKRKVKFADGKEDDKEIVKPYLGSNKSLKEGETLEFSNEAYEMLHRVTTEWPCLSFDVILPIDQQCAPKDRSYLKMNKYPYSVYLAAGSQSSTKNAIYLMELAKLHKTKYDDESEDGQMDSEDSDYDEDPEINIKSIPVKFSTNRLISLWNTPVVAAWHENGDLSIYNLEEKMSEFEDKNESSKPSKKGNHLLQTFKNHDEGYAINFSPLKRGLLASGSNDNKIYTYEPDSLHSTWCRSEFPYTFHKGPVEDIQFSPAEEFAFASCSVDCSVKVCDMRVGNRKEAQISINKAHSADINVISWNKSNPFLIASGADDGCFKVWDLKFPKTPITEIVWHNEAITSICFQPNDESVLAVSSDDNRLSLWDFSCEPVNPEENNDEEIPDQLLFLHQGQEHLKEIRFHPIFTEMIISTSLDGFHVFKPALDQMPEEEIEEEKEEDIPKVKLSDLDNYLSKMKISK